MSQGRLLAEAPTEADDRLPSPTTESMGRAIEHIRSEQAALLIQRCARGHAVRAERRRLAWAVELSQRQWRVQRASIAVLQMQLAVRTMLEQRRAALEAEALVPLPALEESSGLTEGGLWHHDRSAEALKLALASSDTLLAVAPAAPTGRVTGLGGKISRTYQAAANVVAGLKERDEANKAYAEAELEGGADGLGTSAPSLVEHCGWLLKQGRAVANWKMRWVMVQAGCIWYFKDESRRELLGRMALASAKVRAPSARRIAPRRPPCAAPRRRSPCACAEAPPPERGRPSVAARARPAQTKPRPPSRARQAASATPGPPLRARQPAPTCAWRRRAPCRVRRCSAVRRAI